jgi:CRISPR-associated exonuclease Cas4
VSPGEALQEEPITISSLEHYSYCPRQYALIHREQTFDENIYTLRGHADHERVDQESSATEEGVRVERGLPLWSAELGLVGKADVVEFHGDVPYPVEYKHGRRKPDRHADLQLCAQAMCLEEMLGLPVPRGAVYHVSSRQRREVALTPPALRERVRNTVEAIRRLETQEKLPPPVNDARCPPCSLIDSCMPAVGANDSRLRTLHRRLYQLEEE